MRYYPWVVLLLLTLNLSACNEGAVSTQTDVGTSPHTVTQQPDSHVKQEDAGP